LTFGIVIAGCDDGNTDDGGDSAKTITITGLSGKSGEAVITLSTGLDDSATLVAAGIGTISGDSASFALLKEGYSPWTGSGSYYIVLTLNDNGEKTYVYTNGGEDPEEDAVAYSISSASTTIPFGKFAAVEVGGGS
jgi:hypothetical protein